MAKFVIRRASPNAPTVGVLPSGADAVLGTAFVIASKDATSAPSVTTDNPGGNTFTLAGNSSSNLGPTASYPVRVGFVTRPVRQIAGLSADEILFGLQTYSDGNGGTTGAGEVMTPFQAGKPGTIQEALALEVEGPDNLVTSGTGAVATNTAVGTKLAFTNGKFYIAQTNDYSEYYLAAQMTSTDGGTVRIFVQKTDGGIVAS